MAYLWKVKSGSDFGRHKEYVDTFLNEYQDEFETFFYAVYTPAKKLEDHIERPKNQIASCFRYCRTGDRLRFGLLSIHN